MAQPVPFRHPVNVRYLEVDRQGVVFNMWYLAYCDDAMTAFLDAGSLSYVDMLAAGTDCQVVHTEIDWHGPLGFGDPAAIAVHVADIGRTSFTLRFEVTSSEQSVATVRTVYVCVATEGSEKHEIPAGLRARLAHPG
jgi:acyl-CoA thioester hydrolase